MRRANRSYPASPGELMDQANILARELLYDAPELDGRTMLRTWGEVVEAAGQVWRQLPSRSDLVAGMDVMNQLERSARTLHNTVNSRSKKLDPTLQEISQLVTRAADVIEHSDVNRPTKRWTRPQLQDAFSARVSLIHTVYLATHAVSVGLAADALTERLARRPSVYAVSAEQLRQRVATVEELACSYLDGHYPGAYDRRHRPPVDNDRLGAAVSAWDVHAQRFLTRSPSVTGMVTIARGMVTTTALARHLWTAAAQTGHVRADQFHQELSPALETMTQTWGATQTLFKDLRHPHETDDPQLFEATRELKAAMLELAWDGTKPASPEVISRRADPADMVRALHRFQAVAAGVSQTFEDAAGAADLAVSAKAANEMLKDRRGPRVSPLVAPSAVVRRAPIPLPPELRPQIEVTVAASVNAARHAMRASMAVSDEVPSPVGSPARSEVSHQALGRNREHNTVMMTTSAVAGPSR